MNGLVAEVLAAWREAERVADQTSAGPEHDRATFAAERLRDVYHELVNAPDGSDGAELHEAIERFRVHGPLTR
jgi:hypothetical protein